MSKRRIRADSHNFWLSKWEYIAKTKRSRFGVGLRSGIQLLDVVSDVDPTSKC